MKQVSLTIKLKFVALNQCKAELFRQMEIENTRLANHLLTIKPIERKKLTTAKVQTSLASAISNQTIRHTNSKAAKKTKRFKKLPVEINKQNWAVHQNGDTYSLSFPTSKGVKRVPIAVASSHWQGYLDRIVSANGIEKGTLKLIFKRGNWYAYLSITLDVPGVVSKVRIGCDRGQNNIAVVAPLRGFGRFFSGKEVMHRRRYFQKRREALQNAGKFRALKKWDRKESRWMDAVDHTISRRIVRFAEFHDADVVFEDLSGCRQTMKQHHKSRRDAATSRHTWSYYSLEQKTTYKLELVGRQAISVPAAYTSKTSSIDGQLGRREGHWFYAPTGELVKYPTLIATQ
jgi:IS605 OrfB family transposase